VGLSAFTACPHGLANEATTAPGNVLSSLAFNTLASNGRVPWASPES